MLDKIDPVREEALKILIKVFNEKSYSNILIKNLGQKYSSLDRAFITEIVYGTIKWKLKIDNVITCLSSIKPEKLSLQILNILRLGIYQIDYMDKIPQSAAVDECVKLAKRYGNPGAVKYVNAVLRNYCRKHDSIIYPDKDKESVHYISTYYSFPEWMVKRLIDEFGIRFTEDFLKASNEIPALTVRINKLRTHKQDLVKSLSDKGIEVQESVFTDVALVLRKVPGIENLEEYKNGLLTVQDESSMIAAIVLNPQPDQFIMDVCSAPGTKSTYIAELMEDRGKVLSGDISSSKLRLVEQNAKRLGINIINTYCLDATKVREEYVNKADGVLIDVPCSGLGIMRKKPEIRWNREIEDINNIKRIQSDILKASSRYVKPGGTLVYSTCTVLKEENIEIINEFIKGNKEFVLEDISGLLPSKLHKPTSTKGFIELYPNVDNIDGFFIARLRRVN